MFDRKLLNNLIDGVKYAGEQVLEVYETNDFQQQLKSDNSPLTQADTFSHKILTECISKLGKLPILSEEGNYIPWEKRRTWNEYWLIDPLDGTKEFIKRNGEFTINVALVKDTKPVLGVVYAPALEKGYFTGVDSKCYSWEKGSEPKLISTASQVRDKSIWRVVGSRSHPSVEFEDFIKKLKKFELVAIGSSLKLCMVAEGKADIYPRLSPTSEWDTAAAQAIVEMSGGVVVKIDDLNPLRYNTKESLINPKFLVLSSESELKKLLEQIGDSH